MVIQYVCRVFISQWIGLMENLQENPRFNGKIYGFRLKDFPNKTNPLNISPIYLAVNVCIDVQNIHAESMF